MNIPANKVKIHDKEFEIAYNHEYLQEVIEQLANRINSDYSGKTITFLIVLKGAMPFAVDLMKSISCECIVETISAKSYGNEMKSSGEVKIYPDNLSVEGKEIIIIEDIVDTGKTLEALKAKLNQQNPNSLEIASLFSKPAQREVEIDVKYIGIEIPPKFIVGYGLDYAEFGRQLPAVYQLCTE